KIFIEFPLVVAALLGLIRLFRVAPLAGWLFAACWTMFPLVYYVVFVDSRYAYPMDQSVLLLSSFALLDALKFTDDRLDLSNSIRSLAIRGSNRLHHNL